MESSRVARLSARPTDRPAAVPRAVLAALDQATARLDAGESAHRVILDRLPWLARQLQTDGRDGTVGRWGLSSVIDENLGRPVIQRPLFEVLHEWADCDSSWPVGNAGVLHCYGYLLSTVKTPYGLKRQRWTEGGVALALGLGAELLPGPSSLSFLARVSAAIGPVLSAPWRTSELFDVTLAIDEPITAHESARRHRLADPQVARTIVIQSRATDQSTPPNCALLYGVGPPANPLAITAFPIAEPSTEWLAALREGPARLRYNAVTADLPPMSPIGSARPVNQSGRAED